MTKQVDGPVDTYQVNLAVWRRKYKISLYGFWVSSVLITVSTLLGIATGAVRWYGVAGVFTGWLILTGGVWAYLDDHRPTRPTSSTPSSLRDW